MSREGNSLAERNGVTVTAAIAKVMGRSYVTEITG